MNEKLDFMQEGPTAIRKLEETVLHQERQIQDLSDMVAAQWQDIDRLKRAMQILQNKLTAVVEDGADGQKEPMSVSEIALMNKPPHY